MGAQYSAVDYTIPRAGHRSVVAVNPHVVPQNFCIMLLQVLGITAIFFKYFLNVSDPQIFAVKSLLEQLVVNLDLQLSVANFVL